MVLSELLSTIEKQTSVLINPSLYIMVITLTILMVSLIIKSKRKKTTSLKIDKKDLFLLIVLIVSFSILRPLLVQPQFIMYTDEGYYVRQGRLLLEEGKIPIENPARSLGWSMLIALSLIFYYSINAVFFLNQILLIGGGVLIYFIVKELHENKWVSLISSSCYLFQPGSMLWSATADNFMALHFFLLLTFFFLLRFLRENKEFSFYLSSAFLGFAVLIRRETVVLFLPLLLITYFHIKRMGKTKQKSEIKNKNIALFLVLIFLLIFPAFFHEFQYYNQNDILWKESNGKFEGAAFGFHNLVYNTKTFLPQFLNPDYIPLVITLTFLFSLGIFFKNHRKRKQQEFLIFMLFSFVSLVFIYFFSWFQTLGGSTEMWVKTKFFCTITLPVIIFNSLGLEKIFSFFRRGSKKIAIYFILILIAISFLHPLLTIAKQFNNPHFVLQFGLTDKVNFFLEENNISEYQIRTVFPELVPLTEHTVPLKSQNLNHTEISFVLLDYSCQIQPQLCEEVERRNLKLVKAFGFEDVSYKLYVLRR
jgi:hypothetical protein